MSKYELTLVCHCDDKEWPKSKAMDFMVSMGVSSPRAEYLLKDFV